LLKKRRYEEILRKQEEHGPLELRDLLLPQNGRDYQTWHAKFLEEKRSRQARTFISVD
jgi:hypothetical protein